MPTFKGTFLEFLHDFDHLDKAVISESYDLFFTAFARKLTLIYKKMEELY